MLTSSDPVAVKLKSRSLAWNNFTIGGVQLASSPVCDTPVSCALMSSLGSACSSLGTTGNRCANHNFCQFGIKRAGIRGIEFQNCGQHQ